MTIGNIKPVVFSTTQSPGLGEVVGVGGDGESVGVRLVGGREGE